MTGLVRMALANASGTLANGLLILLAVVFMLLEAPSLRTKLQAAFNLTSESETQLRRFVARGVEPIIHRPLALIRVRLSPAGPY